MQPKIRLIALDLDGTLMNRKKEITARTRAVIREATEAGILVMPATGRPATGFPDVLEAIPECRYALTSNGALVYDFREAKPIYEDLISVENGLFLNTAVDVLIAKTDGTIESMAERAAPKEA